jgi:hypothetical protein
MALISGLLWFAAYAVVIDPVRETGFVPSTIFRTEDPKYNFAMDVPVWSIVAVSRSSICFVFANNLLNYSS